MGQRGAFLTIRLLFAVLAASYTAVAKSQTRGRDDTFDYVVVGGGTAGLALASRLAEDFSRTVAVIEAGGFYEQDNGNISIVPAYCTIGAGTDPADFNPLVDWGFVTQPLKVYHSLPHNTSPSLTMQQGVDGRRIHYTRGKTLGGTSARNYMYYQR